MIVYLRRIEIKSSKKRDYMFERGVEPRTLGLLDLCSNQLSYTNYALAFNLEASCFLDLFNCEFSGVYKLNMQIITTVNIYLVLIFFVNYRLVIKTALLI